MIVFYYLNNTFKVHNHLLLFKSYKLQLKFTHSIYKKNIITGEAKSKNTLIIYEYGIVERKLKTNNATAVDRQHLNTFIFFLRL